VSTFALFGPTDDRRTAPMVSGGQVLRHPLECAPCDQQTCPLLHQACLRDLAPSEVFAAVAAQLDFPQAVRLDVALPAGA
jgi:ADP-heptose:LPS heptosyltransferase